MKTRPAPRWLPIMCIATFSIVTAVTSADDAQNSRVTFYKDIVPILQENCQECHRPAGTNYGGLIAPMSLIEYKEVRPWAKSIAQQVKTHEMPPWDADRSLHGVFVNERSITDEQIATLVRWSASGAPAGRESDAPAPKLFQNNDGWMIGEPDLIVVIPEPFHIGDEIADLYTAHHVDLTLDAMPEDRWITAFQCKPGTDVIHHFNCHLLPPDEDGNLPDELPFAGRISPVGAGTYIGGTASGTDAIPYPEGFGLLIKKGTRVTFDIHYHKEAGPGTARLDSSSAIGFKLTSTPPIRQIGGGTNGRGPISDYRFQIPPRDGDYQVGPISRTWTQESDLIGMMPHLHLRGSRAKFEAFYPDGTDEVLLYVPSYDFSWQTHYRYDELKRIPAGTRIEFTAWFDNSPEKAELYNFDSNKTVIFGPESTDEMMMGFVTSAVVEPEPEEN